MKKILDYYFPDDEHHFSKTLRKSGQYQNPIRELAFEKVENFNVSLDIGANLGIFSRAFENKFKKNYAIEPFAEHIKYLKLNAPNTTVFQYAISDVKTETTIKMQKEPFNKNCGMSKVSEDGNTDVNCISLDLLHKKYNLPYADLIKMDVEYHELQVLQGGENYIKSSWPVLIIEHTKNSPVEAFLKTWGYHTGKTLKIKNDNIYVKVDVEEVYVGSNSTLLPVTICDDVVIGAGSVVTKDITEPGTYVGNPARKLEDQN